MDTEILIQIPVDADYISRSTNKRLEFNYSQPSY